MVRCSWLNCACPVWYLLTYSQCHVTDVDWSIKLKHESVMFRPARQLRAGCWAWFVCKHSEDARMVQSLGWCSTPVPRLDSDRSDYQPARWRSTSAKAARLPVSMWCFLQPRLTHTTLLQVLTNCSKPYSWRFRHYHPSLSLETSLARQQWPDI